MYSKNNASEKNILKQSCILMFITGASAIMVGVASGSQAILFDGYFALIAAFIKGLMLLTATYVHRAPTRKFQFGFWHFEPMVLAVEGAFIGLLAIYAFVSGVKALFNQGQIVKLEFVLVYTFIFTLLNFGYYFYVKHRNKRIGSKIVAVDNLSWFVDGLLIGGTFLSFLIAYLLLGTKNAAFAQYVDAIVLMLLALGMLPSVYQILKPSLIDIFGITPPEINQLMEETMAVVKAEYGFLKTQSYVQKSGSGYFIEINILVDPDYQIHSITEVDRIRNDISSRLNKIKNDKWITISLTCDKKWF